jgi:predicted RNase H-like HicB family nuclease
MFTEYVDKAMKLAQYEMLEDDEGYFGTIPGFQGLWASDQTLEGCREELRSVLEGWLILGLWLNDENLPVLGKLDLVPRMKGRGRGASVTPRTRKTA